MTREEAIKVLKNTEDNINYDTQREEIHFTHEWVGAYEMAISALREQEERSKGCEWCLEYKSIIEENGDFISLDETGAKGIFLEACTCDVVLEAKVPFCPMCGRRLEEV